MSENNKIPKLRFNGFADAWEQRKVGDVFTERSERSGEGELISVTINSGVVKASELDRKDNSSNDKSNYKKVEVGDIAYNSMRMWQGASGYSSYEGILSPAYTVIIPKNGVDSKFFAYDFKRYDMIQTFKRNSQGLTSDTWNLKFPTLKSVKVSVPCIEEQMEISIFFEKLDNLITLHQRKHDLLVKTKQSYLQKMFPKNGEDFPEVRFAGFTDAWEQRKFGDFVVDYVEKTTVQNQFPVLTSSQQHGVILQEEYFSNRQITTENNIGYYVLPKGYFTFRSRSDNNVFVFNRNNIIEKGIISYFYPVFTISNADSDFFLKRINNGVQRQLSIQAEGTGQHVLSLKKFKNIVAMFPSLEEQIKIGNFFQHLENNITLHQRELDSLKDLKKSFLQNMFI